MNEKICVVGSGAREHALALSLAKSGDEIIVTPGNPGMTHSFQSNSEGESGDHHSQISVTPLSPKDIDANLYIIGPEGPLVSGLADQLRSLGKKVVGPGSDGAKLEGSKIWMKQMLLKAGVPTAEFGVFDEYEKARRYLKGLKGPWVIKTDGLAGGKGVLVTDSLGQATEDVKLKLSGESFGVAGTKVVIEEFMEGRELSLMVLSDGKRLAPLALARDAKRIFDNDEGPNTGGMGAFSPVFELGVDMNKLVDEAMEIAVEPLLGVLQKEGIDYRGILYAGLMIGSEGLKVVEYNVRFGDPETQAILPLLENDLVELLDEVACGKLRSEPRFSNQSCLNVVVSAPGYPQSPITGQVIEIDTSKLSDSTLYFAGVAEDESGNLVSAGGRVLSLSAVGENINVAREKAYKSLDAIYFEGMHFRNDIGKSNIDF